MCSQILVDPVHVNLTVNTMCLVKASNSTCYSSDMFRHLKGHYQGVNAVPKVTVHKSNIAYTNIQICIHCAILGNDNINVKKVQNISDCWPRFKYLKCT